LRPSFYKLEKKKTVGDRSSGRGAGQVKGRLLKKSRGSLHARKRSKGQEKVAIRYLKTGTQPKGQR